LRGGAACQSLRKAHAKSPQSVANPASGHPGRRNREDFHGPAVMDFGLGIPGN